MADTISVRFGKDLQKDLIRIEKEWHTGRSEVLRRLLAKAVKEWKIENALEELKKHNISIGKAAEMCNISIWEIVEMVKDKNIDWTGYTEKDLKRDLEIIK